MSKMNAEPRKADDYAPFLLLDDNDELSFGVTEKDVVAHFKDECDNADLDEPFMAGVYKRVKVVVYERPKAPAAIVRVVK